MITKQYYPELDIVKGIAILCVISAHCINDEMVIPQTLYYFLHVFSMPLFMLASGFLFSMKDKWKSFLEKKVKRLVIPYFSFGILTIAIRYAGSAYSRTGEINLLSSFCGLLQGDYYWFLYALFIFMIVCKILKYRCLLILLAVCSFFVPYIYTEYNTSFIIERLIVYPFYFIIGIEFKRYYGSIKVLLLKKLTFILTISTITFVLLISPTFLKYNHSLHFNQLLGCFVCWLWAIYISERLNGYIPKVLQHFGHYSLQYYLNHLRISLNPLYGFFFSFLQNGVVLLIFVLVLRSFMSWIALCIEKRYKPLRLLCGL